MKKIIFIAFIMIISGCDKKSAYHNFTIRGDIIDDAGKIVYIDTVLRSNGWKVTAFIIARPIK